MTTARRGGSSRARCRRPPESPRGCAYAPRGTRRRAYPLPRATAASRRHAPPCLHAAGPTPRRLSGALAQPSRRLAAPGVARALLGILGEVARSHVLVDPL